MMMVFLTVIIHILSLQEPTCLMIVKSGSDEQEEENVNVELGGVSNKCVWQNIGLFPISQKAFCDVYGP
jgi:hypothetical protein